MRERSDSPTREIICTDAVPWLKEQPSFAGCSFVASLPDFSEFGSFSLDEWKSWFTGAVALILDRCPPDGVAIFYQTDIKNDGIWVDKGFLCQLAAHQASIPTLWHKVVCRAPPGVTTYGRPAFSHFICFSKEVRLTPAESSPDVLPRPGETTWTRGMGLDVCRAAVNFVRDHTKSHTIVDPFCGHGSVLAVANEMGLHAIGVDRGGKRAEKAKTLQSQANGFKSEPQFP